MSYSVKWTESAVSDLRGIVDYIELDSVKAAASVYRLIRTSCDKLKSFPKSGRIVPELKNENIELYREVITSHWRIIFSIEGRNVFILTVLDSRRDLDFVLIARALGIEK
jgi:plasmid stabilization system protein ParE